MELTYFDDKSDVFQTNRKSFDDFLREGKPDVYQPLVVNMLQQDKRRLIVDMNDLRQHDVELATRVLQSPMEYLMPFATALKEYALGLEDVRVEDPDGLDLSIGFSGSFGAHRVSPRELMAHHLARLVCVEGIVTQCSVVRPKVVRTVHFCEATKRMTEQDFHDATSLSGFPTGSVYPTKDAEDNPLTTEFGLSYYKDHQVVTIQEMPERAPAGQLPCSVDVVLDGDLVDQCKPGDRVQIIGVYRTLPSSGSAVSGMFKTMLIANNVRHIGKESNAPTTLSKDDIVQIRKLAKRKDIFDLLARSIAPSIHGHAEIKKALVLLLLGGVEHNLENGTHIRGDINVLMVGDPSTAKSQLLRSVLHLAPLAINTTGRGSSGVGLTAAVTTDKETGERRLEAGAMVLGDRGVVCIDEFDKMGDNDRVAIHEVMEQQTVTIAKAGIHMSLNARCSVVAASNPIYGQYDRTKPPMWNVNLPDSLLSRFDLLFIVLDEVDASRDRMISDHVLRNHRYQGRPGDAFEDAMLAAEDDDQNEDAAVFQKYDRLLHGHLGGGRGRRGRKHEVLTVPFFKKYVQFAKRRFEPNLTEDAAQEVAIKYAKLRTHDRGNGKTLPITARSLETIIRLSSAHAKVHLREEVSVDDVDAAFRLMKFALYHKVIDEDDSSDDEEDDDNDDDDVDPDKFFGFDGKTADREEKQKEKQKKKKKKKRRSSKKKQGASSSDDDESSDSDFDLSDGDDEFAITSAPSKKKSPSKRRKSPKRKSQRDDDGDVDMAPAPSSPRRSKVAAAAAAAKPKSPRRSKKRSRSKSPASSPRRRAATSPKKASPKRRRGAPVSVSAERLVAFRTALSKMMRRQRDQDSFEVQEVIDRVNAAQGDDAGPAFKRDEVEVMLKRLDDDNKVMFKRGVVHRIN